MKTTILTEETFPQRIGAITEELNAIRESGTFERVPGQPIYYELYHSPNAKGWVAISHGFTESTAKYAEVIWYLIQEGYSAAICDHRGHGKSYHGVAANWLIHVNRFEDYSDDFNYFLRSVVQPAADALPLYLFGHSMGGAVAAHVAERFPDLPIRKLILCSPMISPMTEGVPRWAALAIARFFVFIGKGKEKVFAHGEFTGKDDFEEDYCCATSRARYDWYHQIQLNNVRYQTCAASYSWLKESLLQTDKVLELRHVRRVTIPVLLLQAGLDNTVDNSKQDELVQKLSDARKVVFPDAKHEIFRCGGNNVTKFMESILDFIAE